jgi:hypothetical protein
MSAKVLEWIYLLIGIGVLVAFLGIPIFWVYATVSECGWKGLFVQCRIEARPK